MNNVFFASKKTFLSFLLMLSAIFGAASLRAQEKLAFDHSYKPLILKLNDDGSKYIRFMNWHQFWATFTQNNPGTTDINGNPKENSTSFGIRRSRFLIYAQISPRFIILTHWGINNQLFDGGSTAPNGPNTGISNGGKKPQIFIHDAITEYEVIKNKLSIGAGLHYWNGVNRMASASTITFMTMDAPIFNWYNIEANDQFARQLGIYAKGQIGRLDYRVAVNKPFTFGSTTTYPAPPGTTSFQFSKRAGYNLTETWSTGGYLFWQFWDKESDKLAYTPGTYLGAKKVLNLGAGWYHHPNAMANVDTLRTNGVLDTVATRYDQRHFGVDVYLDMPLGGKEGNKGCLSAYLLYQNMGFGPNFVRNLGIMNEHLNVQPGNTQSWAGGGNLQPTMGTGNIVYLQVGYALPKFANGHQIMPYATTTYKKFDGLRDASTQFDFGLNYFIAGHSAKLTLQYSTRPIYTRETTTGDIIGNGYRGQLTLQSQIFL